MSIPTSYRPVIENCEENALNLNTYGAVDWIVFLVVLMIYSCCCCGIGVCIDRWRFRKHLLTDADIDDIQSVKRAEFNSVISKWTGNRKSKSKQPPNIRTEARRENSQDDVMLTPLSKDTDSQVDFAPIKPDRGDERRNRFSTIEEEKESNVNQLANEQHLQRPDFKNKHLVPAMQKNASRDSMMSEVSMTSTQIQPIVGQSFYFPAGKADKVRDKMKQKYKGKEITVVVQSSNDREKIASAAPAAPVPAQQAASRAHIPTGSWQTVPIQGMQQQMPPNMQMNNAMMSSSWPKVNQLAVDEDNLKIGSLGSSISDGLSENDPLAAVGKELLSMKDSQSLKQPATQELRQKQNVNPNGNQRLSVIGDNTQQYASSYETDVSFKTDVLNKVGDELFSMNLSKNKKINEDQNDYEAPESSDSSDDDSEHGAMYDKNRKGNATEGGVRETSDEVVIVHASSYAPSNRKPSSHAQSVFNAVPQSEAGKTVIERDEQQENDEKEAEEEQTQPTGQYPNIAFGLM